MTFHWITLKPLSLQILRYIAEHDGEKASELAEGLGLSTKQVDAAVTKSLVRHGLVIREAKLTRLQKKDYNIIKITERGKNYLTWLSEQAQGEP
jgi:DNA-binding MarR family transcriptional regulator